MIDENELLKYAKKNKEGFTVRLKGNKIVPVKASPKNRFVVADRTVIVYTPKTRKTEILGKINPNRTYGGWYDKQTGKYLIETNDLYSKESVAKRVGKMRRQKAVFDLRDMRTIELSYPEGALVTGIRPKRIRDVVVKKGNRYYNKITGKYTTKNTAKKLNKYFKAHPDATLYEAHSQPTYKKHEKWEKQSNKIVDLYKKSIQVIKTKDRFGNDVYYSPILKKRVTKEQMKEALRYDYQDGQFRVSLYRLTVDKGSVYHIIKTYIGRTFTLDEIADFHRFKRHFMKTWTPDAMRITRQIAINHPLDKYQRMYISFKHEYYLTNYRQKQDGAVTVMNGVIPQKHVSMMPNEIERAFKMYGALIGEYAIVTILEVSIYITSSPSEKTRAMAENRLGVFNRNGHRN